MGDIDYVLERMRAGDKVVFGRDVYGQRFVELWRGRLIPRCSKVDCTADEIHLIKRALLQQAQATQAAA